MIGFYSTDPQRNYLDDCSRLKYLRKIPEGLVQFDLNHNVEIALKRTQNEERLKSLLSFLRDHREGLDVLDEGEVSLDDVPFVFHRGFLCGVCSIPYDNTELLRFSVCLFRGVMYMHSLWTAETEEKHASKSTRQKRSSAWGHKFEQFLVSDDPNGNPDTESPTDENSSFHCVLESHLNRHRLVYAAEMDCVLVEGSSLKEGLRSGTHSAQHILRELSKSQFIELKTNGHIKNDKDEKKFRTYVTRRWWLQCFLSGIETVVCGCKDGEGVVTEIKHYRVSDLLHMKSFWDPNVCLNFCDELLKYVKECFTREIGQMPTGSVLNVRNLPKMELVFESSPGSDVRLVPPRPGEDISLLTDWFIDMFSNA